jgi:hypothetical protein
MIGLYLHLSAIAGRLAFFAGAGTVFAFFFS